MASVTVLGDILPQISGREDSTGSQYDMNSDSESESAMIAANESGSWETPRNGMACVMRQSRGLVTQTVISLELRPSLPPSVCAKLIGSRRRRFEPCGRLCRNEGMVDLELAGEGDGGIDGWMYQSRFPRRKSSFLPRDQRKKP